MSAAPLLRVAVDCVVLGVDDEGLKVLLVERSAEPFRGRRALPGGFLRPGESLEEAARRALRDETGVSSVFLEQLYSFGDVGRDPRGRVVTVAYSALVKLCDHRVLRATSAGAAWCPVVKAPPLAFDHGRILEAARERLKARVRDRPLGLELLPPRFTLSQLQRLYETVLEKPLDKRNFRKKILSMELLEETDELQRDVAHRAARLYRFDPRKYRQLEQAGLHFEVSGGSPRAGPAPRGRRARPSA